MKLIRLIPVLLLCSNLFISCNDTETDEELQMLIDNQEIVADDSGGDINPPSPPPPPPGS
ncbi:hypothetical protein [Lutibacter sp.]|uniref:hypothetical protein n=1 Tax=Lutibacter sp. TaxID=1925666 RepID=UPI0025C3C30D|nr:hypothetical protein [Lutibacter sp.]MCF6168214.1 hypothetical protein [Lutibacter sp.]